MPQVLNGARAVFLLTVGSFVAGCGGRLGIDYRSTATTPPPPPAAGVMLRVLNVRDAAHGGLTERVGTIYSSYGGMYGGPRNYSGRAVDAGSPETVADTVRAATADALAHAGVSIRSGGPTLIASVREYWMDGHDIKRAVVVVSYDLTDHAGRVLWHTEARGDGSVMMTVGNGLVKMFRAALTDLAQHACDAFLSPDFQTALRRAP